MQVMLPEAPHPGGGFPKSSFFYQVCRTAKKQFFFWGVVCSPHILDRFIQTEERVYIFLTPSGSEHPFFFVVRAAFHHRHL